LKALVFAHGIIHLGLLLTGFVCSLMHASRSRWLLLVAAGFGFQALVCASDYLHHHNLAPQFLLGIAYAPWSGLLGHALIVIGVLGVISDLPRGRKR
jgi:hypothetical protein